MPPTNETSSGGRAARNRGAYALGRSRCGVSDDERDTEAEHAKIRSVATLEVTLRLRMRDRFRIVAIARIDDRAGVDDTTACDRVHVREREGRQHEQNGKDETFACQRSSDPMAAIAASQESHRGPGCSEHENGMNPGRRVDEPGRCFK